MELKILRTRPADGFSYLYMLFFQERAEALANDWSLAILHASHRLREGTVSDQSRRHSPDAKLGQAMPACLCLIIVHFEAVDLCEELGTRRRDPINVEEVSFRKVNNGPLHG